MTKVLLLKFISALIAFAIGLDLFFDASIAEVLSFSLMVTIISYVVGDRLILSRLGNGNALVVDFLLTYITVWVFGNVVLNSYLQIAWGSIITATLITGAEVLIHKYILKRISLEEPASRVRSFQPKLAYGMEMAEEQDPKLK